MFYVKISYCCFLIIAMVVLSFIMPQGLISAHEDILMSKEPQNINEFNCLLNARLKSQPFIYTFASQQMSIPDNDSRDFKHLIKIDMEIGASAEGAIKHFLKWLNIRYPHRFAGPADAVAGLNYEYSIAPKNFFFSRHDNDQIGNMSFDRRFGIWANDPVNCVFFIRGNCVIVVSSPHIGFRYGGVDGKTIELIKSPDPREIAWRIDQYLKGDPLEGLSDAGKQKLKTLEITLPKEAEFEQGKEYPLDFPRKQLDGTVPAEIRLVVSRGEIQQVIDKAASEDPKVFPNPASLAPEIDGKYIVLFGKPEKQTIHCYHINEKGQCLAWGEVKVFVQPQTMTKEKTDTTNE